MAVQTGVRVVLNGGESFGSEDVQAARRIAAREALEECIADVRVLLGIAKAVHLGPESAVLVSRAKLLASAARGIEEARATWAALAYLVEVAS